MPNRTQGDNPPSVSVHSPLGEAGAVSGRTWHIELDGHELILVVEHDPGRRDVVVRVDGYPIARAPWNAEPTEVVFRVDGRDASARVVPSPQGWQHTLTLDGRVWTDTDAARPAGPPARRARLARLDVQRFLRLLLLRDDGAGAWITASLIAGLVCTVCGASRTSDVGIDALTQAWGVAAVTALLAPLLWTNGALDQTRGLARHGDVLPGRVIALHPVRVAIALDVSWAEDGQHPAVLVTHQPLDRVRPGGVAVGDTATVLVERRSTGDGVRFDDILVVAAECLTDDPLALADLAERIDPEARDAFEAFDAWYELAERPLHEGVHPLRAPVVPPEGEPTS